MALIKCTKCGQMISDKASKCPKCGYPVKQKLEEVTPISSSRKESETGNRKTSLLFVLVAILAAIISGFAVWYFTNSQSQADADAVEKTEDASIAQSEENKVQSKEHQSQEYGDKVVASNGIEYTDLGLSVLWSNHNVGASDEKDNGTYYGWGNTNTNLSTNLNEYPCASPPSSIHGTEYDVAHEVWGGGWRMPTLAELKELKNLCDWELVEYSQKTFYKVTGPNGNSILLPLAGYKRGDEYKSVGEGGFIWSSELFDGNNQFAANLTFGKKGYVETSGYFRYGGQSIRPVIDKK